MNYEALVKKLRKGWFTLKQLKCRHSDLMNLKQQGFRLNIRNFDGKRHYSVPTEAENPSMFISAKSKKKKTVKWLELSDIHAGSFQFDREGLRQVLKRAVDEGIADVHISGDLCDGYHVYPGHKTNLRFWRAEDQANELAEILCDYPLRYIAIKGNHCYSYEKQGAPNPINLIEAQVPDFHFIDSFAGDLVICGVVKRMVHGASGRCYALSYAGQTYIRDLLSAQGENVYVNGNRYRLRFIQMGH